MISSFHAVFGLRHRDKTAKVIDYKGQVIRAQGITSFTHGYCRFAWLRHNNGSAEISWGLTVTHMEWVFLPFSLIQNRADDFGASFAHLRRKALQLSSQTFETLLVMTAVVHAEDHYVLAGTVSVHWHCDAVGSAQALLRFGQRWLYTAYNSFASQSVTVGVGSLAYGIVSLLVIQQ